MPSSDPRYKNYGSSLATPQSLKILIYLAYGSRLRPTVKHTLLGLLGPNDESIKNV
jgi:hypothetical protein